MWVEVEKETSFNTRHQIDGSLGDFCVIAIIFIYLIMSIITI